MSIGMSATVLRGISLATIMAATVVWAQSAQALEGGWYVGAGAGVSRLSPDTEGSNYTLADDSSVATGIYLGRDITNSVSAELAFTDLGKATLSGGESITYRSFSIGGIAYLFGSGDIRDRQQGTSSYLRLGFNSIENDASIDLNKADNTALWLGVGVQLPVGKQWGLRAELTSFDGDVQTAMASVYWRTAADQRTSAHSRTLPGTAAVATLSAPQPNAARPTATQPNAARPNAAQPPQPPATVKSTPPAPVSNSAPLTLPRVTTSASCSVPAIGEPRDKNGCALFSGILEGVDFQPGTSQLTALAQRVLDQLAVSLKRYPDVIVEVQVHTEPFVDANRAMQLSRERVLAVARYLSQQLVDVKRLRARAFGSTQPRTDNRTEEGRRLNNRVLLRVL